MWTREVGITSDYVSSCKPGLRLRLLLFQVLAYVPPFLSVVPLSGHLDLLNYKFNGS